MASDLHYAGGAPELSDRAAKTNRLAPAVEEPKPAAPTPAQAPGPLAGGRPAEQDLREVQSTGSLDRGNNAPDRRLATPPAAARDEAVRAAEKPQSRADQTGLAQLGNAAAPAAAPAISSVGEVAAKALQFSPSERSAKRRAGFRQVEMEEAVRTLAGSIRLVDGLQPVRILLGPPPIGTEADSTSDLIRVVYLDHPGREFWLDQQRAVAEEPASGARYRAGLLAGDTVFSQLAEGSASLRWVDQTGFRLALTGFMSADSLRALMGRVH